MPSGRIFRGKRPLGWSGRKVETRSHARRTYARKKTQWVVPYCVVCQPVCVQPATTCPNGGSIALLANSELRSQWQDAARVVRILGDVWFRPLTQAITGTCDLTELTRSVQFAMGLKKSRSTDADLQIARAVNPLDCGLNEFSGGDFGDARFMHQWHYTWSPGGKFRVDAIIPTCCSVQDGYTVPAMTGDDTSGTSPGATSTVVGGQASYAVPPIECTTCGKPEDCIVGVDVDVIRAHHVHIDWKKPINLSESDSLALWYGWESMGVECLNSARRPQVQMAHWGQIRLLIEK